MRYNNLDSHIVDESIKLHNSKRGMVAHDKI